jgi:bacterioferritin
LARTDLNEPTRGGQVLVPDEAGAVAAGSHLAHVDAGPVTANYGLDQEEVVARLNTALATEIVCWLRYLSHYHAADGIRADVVAAELLEHATAERDHAERLAKRIAQLGGMPDLDPGTLVARSHAPYREATNLDEVLAINLEAERVAVEFYRGLARWAGDRDPTTRRLVEEILADEEEHADDLVSLMRGGQWR